jgi:hypothetical protein
MPNAKTFRTVVARVLTVRDETSGRESSGTAFHSTGNLPREFGAGEEVLLREVTADEIRSERQMRYWFVAIVGFFVEQWERDLGKRYSKEEAHAALMVAFGGGPVDTPLGPSYPSSKLKTKREFAEITNLVREYVWHKHQVNIPSGEDWMREHCA